MKRHATDYSKKTKVDLQKKITELCSEMREMKFKLAANQLKEVRKMRAAKKEIARLKTAMTAAFAVGGSASGGK